MSPCCAKRDRADGTPSGFSIALTEVIAEEPGRSASFDFYGSFPEMLSALEEGLHDGAIVSISITANRERIFDFSQPILSTILTRDFLIAIVAALGLLFGSGMLMWVFEWREQIDRALLDLREDGTYDNLVVEWFGRP